MCEFCEKFDFSTAKAEVTKYGAYATQNLTKKNSLISALFVAEI